MKTNQTEGLKKWWIISTKGNPVDLLVLEDLEIPAVSMYTGFKGYYQVYWYGTHLEMKRLYASMQDQLPGRDVKIIGEQEIDQASVLADPGLKLKFAPILRELNLLT